MVEHLPSEHETQKNITFRNPQEPQVERWALRRMDDLKPGANVACSPIDI
jgi:hypothetical protein